LIYMLCFYTVYFGNIGHGEFDFSDERMVDSMGLTSPKIPISEPAELFVTLLIHSIRQSCKLRITGRNVYSDRIETDKSVRTGTGIMTSVYKLSISRELARSSACLRRGARVEHP
jgi:hypothetical protein